MDRPTRRNGTLQTRLAHHRPRPLLIHIMRHSLQRRDYPPATLPLHHRTRTVRKHHRHRRAGRQLRRRGNLRRMARRNRHPQIRRRNQRMERIPPPPTRRRNARSDHLPPSLQRTTYPVPRLRPPKRRRQRIHLYLRRTNLPLQHQRRKIPHLLGRPPLGYGRRRNTMARPRRPTHHLQLRLHRHRLPPPTPRLCNLPLRRARRIRKAHHIRRRQSRTLRTRQRQQPIRRNPRQMAKARPRRLRSNHMARRHIRPSLPPHLRLLTHTTHIRHRLPTTR